MFVVMGFGSLVDSPSDDLAFSLFPFGNDWLKSPPDAVKTIPFQLLGYPQTFRMSPSSSNVTDEFLCFLNSSEKRGKFPSLYGLSTGLPYGK